MKIIKQKEQDELTVKIEGALDIKTAPELSKEVMGELEGVKNLSFDLAGTDYISSSGLRVILGAFQVIAKNGGSMSIINVNEEIYDILKLSGFTDFIDIRQAQS